MTIRSKLRAQAELKIIDMIEKLEQRAIEVCGDSPVEPHELCRLVATPKNSKTLMAKLQTRIANQMEDEILHAIDPPAPGENLVNVENF